MTTHNRQFLSVLDNLGIFYSRTTRSTLNTQNTIHRIKAIYEHTYPQSSNLDTKSNS